MDQAPQEGQKGYEQIQLHLEYVLQRVAALEQHLARPQQPLYSVEAEYEHILTQIFQTIFQHDRQIEQATHTLLDTLRTESHTSPSDLAELQR